MSRPRERSGRRCATRERTYGNRSPLMSRYASCEGRQGLKDGASFRSRSSWRTHRLLHPLIHDLRQRRSDLDRLLRAPRLEGWQDAWFDPETVDADRAEDGREEADGPDGQEENALFVRISRRVEEGHEARKEGDRPDRSEDALEQ